MAVVIQEMVNAAVSGVAFSLHPSYGVDNVMSVECVYGAGEALVSGKVTPYAFNVDWVEKTVQKEGKEDEEKQGNMSSLFDFVSLVFDCLSRSQNDQIRRRRRSREGRLERSREREKSFD